MGGDADIGAIGGTAPISMSAVIPFIFLVLFAAGLTVLAFLLAKGMRARHQITENQVASRWDRLIPGKAQKKEEFFAKVRQEIKKKELGRPVAEANVSAGAFGRPETYIVVENGDHSCYIGAVVEGTDLHANWALRRKLSSLYLMPGIGPALYKLFHGSDFNKVNRINAFADVVLDCAGQAAFDISDGTIERKVERKRSGKLGPL